MEKLHSVRELRIIAKETLLKAKAEIIEKVSNDCVTHIKEDSGDKFKADLMMKQDGFIVGEIPKDDNERAEYWKIEEETKAHFKQYSRIAARAYINKLLGKGS